MAKAQEKPKESAKPEEPEAPATPARPEKPKKERILHARLQKKAYVRKDPGCKPTLLPEGTEIMVLESAFSDKYMQDITAEVRVRAKEKDRRRKAIAKAERELAAEAAADDE